MAAEENKMAVQVEKKKETKKDEAMSIDELEKSDNATTKIADIEIATASALEPVVATPPATSTRGQRGKKLLPRHIRDSRSRSQSPMLAGMRYVDSKQISIVKENEEEICEGTKVFAKWVERTHVSYWPGLTILLI